MDKLGVVILGVIGFMAFIALMGVYHAFVLATLWAWFVVPLGVVKIGMAQAYGLSLIPTTILGTRGLYPSKENKTESAIAGILLPAIVLLFGWIALGFI